MKLPQRSEFVELVMLDAPEQERAEATRTWYLLLLRLYRIAERRLEEQRDSPETLQDGRVTNINLDA